MRATFEFEIEDKKYTLPAQISMAACRIYRAQFSRDLLQDIKQVLKEANPNPFDKIDVSSLDLTKSQEDIQKQMLSMANVGALVDANTNGISYETTEIGAKIIWAHAKAADNTTQPFTEWIDRFELLPVVPILEQIDKLWGESARPTITLKN